MIPLLLLSGLLLALPVKSRPVWGIWSGPFELLATVAASCWFPTLLLGIRSMAGLA